MNKKLKIIIPIAIVAVIGIVFAVMHDWNPPVVEGINDSDTVDVEFGESFNVQKYVGERIKVSDEEGKADYSIAADTDSEKYYDEQTGLMNSLYPGDYNFTVIAKDEANNETEVSFIVKVKQLHITKSSPKDILIYDGEAGTINLSVASSYDGMDGYYILYTFDNKTDETVPVYAEPYIDNTKVETATSGDSVAAHRRGVCNHELYGEFPKDFKTVELETSFVLNNEMTTLSPIVIDKAAFK